LVLIRDKLAVIELEKMAYVSANFVTKKNRQTKTNKKQNKKNTLK